MKLNRGAHAKIYAVCTIVTLYFALFFPFYAPQVHSIVYAAYTSF